MHERKRMTDQRSASMHTNHGVNAKPMQGIAEPLRLKIRHFISEFPLTYHSELTEGDSASGKLQGGGWFAITASRFAGDSRTGSGMVMTCTRIHIKVSIWFQNVAGNNG